jgi:hypothetical protein
MPPEIPSHRAGLPDPAFDPDYESPEVEDLGTFAELTQLRIVPRVSDNAQMFGTQ